MDMMVTLLALLLLVGATAALFFVLHQAQIARLAEATVTARLQAREAELANLQQKLISLHSLREENASLKTRLTLELQQFEQKQTLLNDSKEQLSVAFKNIANEIFEDKSKKFASTSKESLAMVLNPLQEKILSFEKKVEETYQKESNERFSLAKEIKNLQELNSKISADAVNLTNALKGDNKAQGNWGEFVLESLLEKSGLVKGREYEVQVSLKAEDGSKSQPDVVVHLPESKDIIIDSKVSLKAWDAYASAAEDTERVNQLKLHLHSIRQHIKGLSAKDYQNLAGVNSLDYVLLFLPIEAAFSMALQHDPELFQFAFERNIIFVGPTTLLTTLKTVHNLWRLAQQSQNAVEIAEQAGRLYDKFVAFVADLDEIGAKIDASKKSFDKAHNKLQSGTGNLIKRVETLRKLGAKTSKKQNTDRLNSALDADVPAATNLLATVVENDDDESDD
ncbi:MAG: DNA recombination protein RmuC [Gammaproteobacteria bacterium]|nr:DNA recombination protein RmuC [Gammaproteobacteria bacterium]